ncbi:MAG: hypothetical protein FWH08_03490 [Oscillospiraceae bacterium]|nr:hypothetical protein [Oscillospiraceae bacterium]
MRVAGNTSLRRYMHNLQRNMSNKNKAENQLYSGRLFNRASENPITAARALRVRKGLYNLETYQDNLKTADMIYTTAESSVMGVSAIMQTVYESLVRGATGSLSKSDAAIVAGTIERNAEEMAQLMNVIVADRRIFGGVNSSSLAFKIEMDPNTDIGGGIVRYHGVPVNQYQLPELFPYSGTSYTDVGIGMTLQDGDTIDKQSAIPVTFSGVDILGCGLDNSLIRLNLDRFTSGASYSLDVSVGADKRTMTFTIPDDPASPGAPADPEVVARTINQAFLATFGNNFITVGAQGGTVINNIAGRPPLTIENTPPPPGQPWDFEQASIDTFPTGFSGNVIQLTLDAARALKADDRERAAQIADALFALQTNVSMTIAGIGNTSQFVEFNLERTTNNIYSLKEQQTDMEASKPEEQITLIKVFEMMFSAQLQMGAQIVPTSIFNFIR